MEDREKNELQPYTKTEAEGSETIGVGCKRKRFVERGGGRRAKRDEWNSRMGRRERLKCRKNYRDLSHLYALLLLASFFLSFHFLSLKSIFCFICIFFFHFYFCGPLGWWLGFVFEQNST